MKNSEYNLRNLSKHLFWDLDTKKMEKKKNKTIIIERVLTRGDIADLKIILRLYKIETIKQEIVKAGFLDKKTLNWSSSFLNIPKTYFRCYSKIQSKQIHWNF